jgi:hypothetical protein
MAIAWQLRENENLGLNIIASLNNRSESIKEIEKEEGETTSQTAALIRYGGITTYPSDGSPFPHQRLQ